MTSTPMSCEFADRDASYVLGALSPAERLEFEQHLAGCDECSRSVRELAGLPGLLARVDPAVLEQPPVDEPVPDTLLPALVREVRHTRRRRSLVTVGMSAAAAVVAVVLALAVAGIVDRSPTTSPSASTPAVSAGRAMARVGDVPVRADVAITSVAWGTRLDLTCTYAPDHDRYGVPRAVTYGLFVRTKDGRTEQVGTWRSVEGKTMRLAAATSAPHGQIASVEIRTASGKTVLRLTI